MSGHVTVKQKCAVGNAKIKTKALYIRVKVHGPSSPSLSPYQDQNERGKKKDVGFLPTHGMISWQRSILCSQFFKRKRQHWLFWIENFFEFPLQYFLKFKLNVGGEINVRVSDKHQVQSLWPFTLLFLAPWTMPGMLQAYNKYLTKKSINLLLSVILCDCGKFSDQETETKAMCWKSRERDSPSRQRGTTQGFLGDFYATRYMFLL